MTHALYYGYDEAGSISHVTVKMGTASETFYYVKNLQGDVTAIVNDEGAVLVQYKYDAWGSCYSYNYASGMTEIESYIAYNNPFRYRGYYYDGETGFYYLNSRYYDPEIGRFLNGDAYVSTGQGLTGYNMYVYCGNNPAFRVDPSGTFFGAIVAVFAVVALVASALTLTSCGMTAEEIEDYDEEQFGVKHYSDGYGSPDAAAIAASKDLARIYKAEGIDREYISALYQCEGKYYYSSPSFGTYKDGWFDPYSYGSVTIPEEYYDGTFEYGTVIGTVHTHPAPTTFPFSEEDYRVTKRFGWEYSYVVVDTQRNGRFFTVYAEKSPDLPDYLDGRFVTEFSLI